MIKLKSSTNIIPKIISWFQEIIVPQNTKIKKILSIDENNLKTLLPKVNYFSRDIFVLFDYQNEIVKLLIKSVKYKNHRLVRERIAKYLYEELVEICSDLYLFEAKLPLLIPIPMSKKEEKERGFNQCKEMVLEIERFNNNNFETDCKNLIKIRETERQTKLKKIDRIKNVINSMKLTNPKKIEGKIIIVFDDVFTTLSTFNEAKRVLLNSRAKRVIGLFIAH